MMRWHLASEQFVRTLVAAVSNWLHVVQSNDMLNCKGPEIGCNDVRPKVHGMNEHGTGMVSDYPT